MTGIVLALALVTVLAMPAGAVELHGRIVRVADGDTVTIVDAAKRQHRIRIVGIDAPKRRQAFGDRFRQRLRELAHGLMHAPTVRKPTGMAGSSARCGFSRRTVHAADGRSILVMRSH
jgi:endonuclease YncB( thermonuclease family)